MAIKDGRLHKKHNLTPLLHNFEELLQLGMALASHQCDSGSNPENGIICGFSLLLVFILALTFSFWFFVFPPSAEATISTLPRCTCAL